MGRYLGWLFGEADYFSFDCHDPSIGKFIYIRKELLIEKVFEILIKNDFKHDKNDKNDETFKKLHYTHTRTIDLSIHLKLDELIKKPSFNLCKKDYNIEELDYSIIKKFDNYIRNNNVELVEVADEQKQKEHIDCVVKTSKQDYKIKLKRFSEEKYNGYDVTEIKLKGLSGEFGWLFGKADFIVFETRNGFLKIPCRKLVKKVLTKLVKNTHKGEFLRGSGVNELNNNKENNLVVKIFLDYLKN